MKQLSILTAILIFLGCSTQKPDEKSSVSKPKKTTIAEIETGIRDYIDRDTSKTGGVFPLPYDKDTMNLKLVRVHTEYLSNLGPGRHFACVDLADEKGDVYDVDFSSKENPAP